MFVVYSIVRDLCSYILAAFGTLCQSKVQDSNDEACSEVAEVPYKVREEQKNKEEQRTLNILLCLFWERSYFIDDYLQ